MKSKTGSSENISVWRGIVVARATSLLKAVRLDGDSVAVGCVYEASWIKGVDENGILDDSVGAEETKTCGGLFGFEATKRLDDGASRRKLQVSLLLSQLAHTGCLPSHCRPGQHNVVVESSALQSAIQFRTSDIGPRRCNRPMS